VTSRRDGLAQPGPDGGKKGRPLLGENWFCRLEDEGKSRPGQQPNAVRLFPGGSLMAGLPCALGLKKTRSNNLAVFARPPPRKKTQSRVPIRPQQGPQTARNPIRPSPFLKQRFRPAGGQGHAPVPL